jgi:hypothetical protein
VEDGRREEEERKRGKTAMGVKGEKHERNGEERKETKNHVYEEDTRR